MLANDKHIKFVTNTTKLWAKSVTNIGPPLGWHPSPGPSTRSFIIIFFRCIEPFAIKLGNCFKRIGSCNGLSNLYFDNLLLANCCLLGPMHCLYEISQNWLSTKIIKSKRDKRLRWRNQRSCMSHNHDSFMRQCWQFDCAD